MRLVLTWPTGWTAAGRTSVHVGDVVPVPDDARGWILGIMRQGLPQGAQLGELMPVAATNELGWPMEVYAAVVTDAAGRTVEARAGAFYKFLEYAAHVLVRAPDAAALDAQRDGLLAGFQSGRPEWRGPGYVAGISELWT